MNKKYKNEKYIITGLLILLILGINASAAKVELINPNILPTSLREEEQINFTIKIGDYEFDNVKQITLETNLISSGDKAIYDFGELNKLINENKYQQKITLNLASLSSKSIQVTISGKAPDGETIIKYDNNIYISKFQESKLKYYEVRTDEKLAGIESFELIIKKKEEFEKTMQQIRRKELDNLKLEVRKLFNLGLTTEAQNIATEMNNIRWPDSLKLFGIIGIENNFWINVIIIIIIFGSFIIGYLLGSRNINDSYDEE